MASKDDRLSDGGPLGSIATVGAVRIVLTFAEIEAVIGPLRAGYVAYRPDFAAETITFRRVAL